MRSCSSPRTERLEPQNLFTGWKDPTSRQGVEEAKAAGQRLPAMGLQFDTAYTSDLTRAQNTLKLVLAELGQSGLPDDEGPGAQRTRLPAISPASTKDDARKKWGESRCMSGAAPTTSAARRRKPEDTVARVLPYYCQHILPRVLNGERVIVAAHGNSLRALVMVLDRLTPETILDGTRYRRAARLSPEGGFDGQNQRRSDCVMDLRRARLSPGAFRASTEQEALVDPIRGSCAPRRSSRRACRARAREFSVRMTSAVRSAGYRIATAAIAIRRRIP